MYYYFDVYFFKIFVSHIFLCKFDLIIWSSTNWLKFHTGVHCCKLSIILICIFFKIFVGHLFLDKFGTKIWSFPNWLKFYTGVHCYMLIMVLFIISKFVIHKFWANLVLKSIMFSKLTEIWHKGTLFAIHKFLGQISSLSLFCIFSEI